jgi:hypothetical protein
MILRVAVGFRRAAVTARLVTWRRNNLQLYYMYPSFHHRVGTKFPIRASGNLSAVTPVSCRGDKLSPQVRFCRYRFRELKYRNARRVQVHTTVKAFPYCDHTDFIGKYICLKLKAKVVIDFIESQTKLLWNLNR